MNHHLFTVMMQDDQVFKGRSVWECLALIVGKHLRSIAAGSAIVGILVQGIVPLTVFADNANPSPETLTELPEYRTAYSKTYASQDGRYLTKTFAERIHVNVNGVFVPIDTALHRRESGSFAYESGINTYRAKFVESTSATSSFMSVAQNGAEIDIAYENANTVNAQVAGSTITYAQLLPGADMMYAIQSELVKGNITLHHPPTEGEIPWRIIERLNVNEGTTLVQQSPRAIDVQRNGSTLWTIQAPSMSDANGELSAELSYELQSVGEREYRVTLTPLTSWIARAAYPVVIDPDFVMGPTRTAYVEEASPNTSTWPQRLMSVGRNTVDGYYKGKTRAYVMFELPTLPSGVTPDDITRADAVFFQYVQYRPYEAQLHEVMAQWDPATLTYNNQPGYNANYVGTAIDGNNRHYIWTMTDLVKQWYRAPSTMNGVMIMSSDESLAGGLFKSMSYPNAPEDQKPHIDVWHNPPNRAPNVPELGDPRDGYEYGGKSSMGGENVQLWVNASDPDNNLIDTEVHIWKDHEHHYRSVGGTGWQHIDIHLSDGYWRWEAKSRDPFGWGGTSPARGFLIDNTAPGQPSMIPEPEFSRGSQNEVTSTSVSDNIAGGIEYVFQRATNESFSANLEERATRNTNYGFAGLSDSVTYYYRVKARDRLGNVTGWSQSTRSTQDNIPPRFTTLHLDRQRISPKNIDGRFDESRLTFAIDERYFDRAQIALEDATTRQRVRTISIGQSGTILVSDPALPDGAYRIVAEAWDKAGNTAYDDNTILIVDDTPSAISVSYPSDGGWFNGALVTMTGQVEADSTLTMRNETIDRQYDPTLTVDGVFSQDVDIEKRENNFRFTDVDNTGNVATQNLTVYREDVNPTITNIAPANTINTRTPTISAALEDKGEEGFVSGLNANRVNLSLTTPEGAIFVLVSNGQNVQPQTGSILHTCSGQGTYGLATPAQCTYSFQFTGELQPDGVYEAVMIVEDIAGNVSATKRQTFAIDTHTTLEANGPERDNLYNFSVHELSGIAERRATVTVTGTTDSIQFQTEPFSDARLTIDNCRPSSAPSMDGVQEICDWRVHSFQLERDTTTDRDVPNTIRYETRDAYGNAQSITHTARVNVHAVTLALNTDLEYFSPNNDGRQDGVSFIDMHTDGHIGTYELSIRTTTDGRTIRQFQGNSALPSSLYFDGVDQAGSVIADGDYEYELAITTTDGMRFTAGPGTISSRTTMDDEVIITHPKNNAVTTRGAIDVMGQAPNDAEVHLCADTIGLPSDCDFDFTVDVNESYHFARVVPLARLPGYEKTEHVLFAWAQDKYGNRTERSNVVRVIVDTEDPLREVSVVPFLTGVNAEAEYDAYLRGEKTIAEMKTVELRAIVSQNTEEVKLLYNPLTNLEELENNPHKEDIATIMGPCTESQCEWRYTYVIPPLEGGIYEMVFRAKKGETISEMTASLMIDGFIPEEPVLVDINTYDAQGKNHNTRLFGGADFTNNTDIEFRGVATPATAVSVWTQGNALCTTTVSDIGIFSCRNDVVGTLGTFVDREERFTLELSSNDGNNDVFSSQRRELVIDRRSPSATSVTSTKEWIRSGDGTDSSMTASEALFGATLTVPHGFVYDYTLSGDQQRGVTDIATPTTTPEGRYRAAIILEDIAGNKGSAEYSYSIDNTPPKAMEISREGWGTVSGYANRDKGYVAKGRLVPGYVVRGSSFTLTGKAEKKSSVEFRVNGQGLGFQPTTAEGCTRMEDDAIIDTIVVRSGEYCDYRYVHRLDQNGGAHIATLVEDAAKNNSTVSSEVTLYADNIPPGQPNRTDTTATTFNDRLNIAVSGEPKSDLHIVVTGAAHTETLHQLDDQGSATYEVRMPSYGVYSVELQSYDAAGNASTISTSTVERVKPPPTPEEVVRTIKHIATTATDVGDALENYRVFARELEKHMQNIARGGTIAGVDDSIPEELRGFVLKELSNDVTYRFPDILEENITYAEHWYMKYNPLKLFFFAENVWPGNEWDLKTSEFEVYTTSANFQGKVVIDGVTYTTEELGNIHFGYTGAAMGIYEPVLHYGSSAAQVVSDADIYFSDPDIPTWKKVVKPFGFLKTELWSSGFEDPNDHRNITIGTELYKKHQEQNTIPDGSDINEASSGIQWDGKYGIQCIIPILRRKCTYER